MATTVRFLSWNIQDLGKDQVKDAEFIGMIADVITNETANLVLILETKADQGDELGKRVKAVLGANWDHNASKPKSAPKGTKPENYVFLWNKTVITSATGFQYPDKQKIGFPNTHLTPKKQSPSRFPYMGKFKAGATTVQVVAYHAPFNAVDIPVANQRLAEINEVKSEKEVIVVGDFNDTHQSSKSYSYKGQSTFGPLKALKFSAKLKKTKTSLKSAYVITWANSLDCRSEEYDNFFVKTSGDLTVKSAKVVDLIVDMTKPNYLHARAKKVFDGWAGRKNAEEAKPAKIKARKRAKRAPFVPFVLPVPDRATFDQAYDAYFRAVSDHLPILLEVDFK
ncbi:MAG: hypothetical protein JNM66_04595 [Bryobacterales bacterium]|nr:hypothetical protein [Bryobacterales bacterium]